MKTFPARVFLLALLLAAWSAGSGSQAEPDWPHGARLKSELTLTNGAEIYMTVAKLFDQRSTLDGRLFEWETSGDLNWVWKSNPAADKLAFTLTLPKGTRVVDVMREIARRRAERLEVADGVLTITPGSDPPVPTTFRQKSTGASAALDALVQEPQGGPIYLEAPDGPGLEDFLNHRLQRGHDRRREETGGREKYPDPVSPFHLKMSAAAKARAEAVNLLGNWTHEGVYDRVSLCAGLRWHIDGNTVIFETAEEQAAEAPSGR